MSDKNGEGHEFTWFMVGLLFGFIISLIAIYNFDSDRADLESCESKLPRDRYCVMLAVPSTVAIDTTIKQENP
jgi:hypothetical protein